MNKIALNRECPGTGYRPETVRENTRTVDITDDYLWMEKARWLTAEAYAALADPKLGMTVEDVYAAVTGDEYERNGQARTLATLTTDPETGVTEITALVRVVVGGGTPEQPGRQPLDAMNFVEPLHGWALERESVNGAKVAELGRYIVVAECRTPEMRRAGVPAWLTRCLIDHAVGIIRQGSVRKMYAIMPAYAARMIHQAGARIRPIESRLKTEDPAAADIFERFSLYWKHASPKLYEWPDAPAPTSSAESRVYGSEPCAPQHLNPGPL